MQGRVRSQALKCYLFPSARESQGDALFFFTREVRWGCLWGQIADAACLQWSRHQAMLAKDRVLTSLPPRRSAPDWRVSMKRAIAAFFVLAATTTTAAVAQDGTGHGPPKLPIIIGPQPLPVPIPTTPTGHAPKLLQPSR